VPGRTVVFRVVLLFPNPTSRQGISFPSRRSRRRLRSFFFFPAFQYCCQASRTHHHAPRTGKQAGQGTPGRSARHRRREQGPRTAPTQPPNSSSSSLLRSFPHSYSATVTVTTTSHAGQREQEEAAAAAAAASAKSPASTDAEGRDQNPSGRRGPQRGGRAGKEGEEEEEEEEEGEGGIE